MSTDPASCGKCGLGTIFDEKTDGRFFEHPKFRSVFINIPRDYVIARCSNEECRQMFFFEHEVSAFWDMLDKELEKHSTMITQAVERYREKQKR